MIHLKKILVLWFLGVGIAFGQGGLGYFSVRGPVATAGVVGSFTIGPEAPKRMLIRAIGPGLVPFGVTGTLVDPRLEVRNAAGEIVAANDNWGEAANASEVAPAASAVGAFPVPAGSKDAVVLATLPPGAYSVALSGTGSGSGLALFEVYDASVTPHSGFAYFGYEGFAGTAASTLLAGCYVTTGLPRRDLLIRALGPSLGPGGLPDPRLNLYGADGTLMVSNDDGEGDPVLKAAATLVGAPPLIAKESAVMRSLVPANYTAEIQVTGTTSGRAKVEFHSLPPGTVESYLPVITQQPAGVTAPLGGTATFSVQASGSGLTYQWRRNGSPLTGATAATLALSGVQAADIGNYDVILTNAAGARTSSAGALEVIGPPVIAVQPASQAVLAGSTLTLTVTASGTGPLTYQWFKGGTALSGASAASLVLANLQPGDAGTYTVAVTGPGGTVPSSPAVIAVGTAQQRALVNLSVRSTLAGSGSSGFFTISPEAPKRVLIRATGPALTPYGVSGVLADPRLEVRNASGQVVAANDNWGEAGDAAAISAATGSVGAFPLSSGSKDAVILAALPPGAYTVAVSGAGSGVGVVLYELYDADTTRIAAFSSLAYEAALGSAESVMIAGFVFAGTQNQEVLLRALGPSLGAGALANPTLNLYSASGTSLAANDDWGGDPALAAAANLVDALPLAGSESALRRMLAPGSHTLHLGAVGAASGRARVEVHAIPVRGFHAADVNQDGRLGLLELTRVIELYNTRHQGARTGGYLTAEAGTEDGFEPAPLRAPATAITLARYHSADTNRDGKIGLLELTRVIELYNYRKGSSRTGQYQVRSGTEDGFEPGS